MTPEMMLAKMLSTKKTETTVEKTASVEDSSENEAMAKLAWADEMGRELAREHMEKEAFLAFGAGKALGALKGMGSAISGAVKAAPGAGKGMLQSAKASLGKGVAAVKAAPGKAADFMKKDLAATKQQFQAGMKGEARPALQKTKVPGVSHNAPATPAVPTPAVPVAPAAPKPAALGMSTLQKGLVGAGVGTAAAAGGLALANRNKQQQPAPQG